MATPGKRRRRSDGTPELRSLDDLLAAAARDAAKHARRLEQHVTLTGTLPATLRLPPLRVEDRLAVFDKACPPVAPLPDGLPERLRRALREHRRTLWQRLLSRR